MPVIAQDPRHSTPPAPHAWLAVAGTFFTIAWGGNEFTPLLKMYQLNGGWSTEIVNVLLGAYVLGIIPALLIGGPLSDRYGRRPLMAPAPVFGVLGSAVLALGAGNPAILFVGRMFSGIALGLVMAVGTSWIKELSSAPYAPRTDPSAGARRASATLTVGFGLGAAVAGALVEWGPQPLRTILPYLVNIALIIALAIPMYLRAPETRSRRRTDTPLIASLKVPKAMHKRFLFVVVPMAPWVFGCAASAYAIVPNLVAAAVPGYEVAFSALLCLIALSAGVAVQPLAKRLDSPKSARATGVALAVTLVGLVLAALTAATLDVWLSLVAAAALGTAYGLLLVSGLQEVQRIAGPGDLAGLTAVYYSLTYLGFFIPAVLALLNRYVTYSGMFLGGAVVCLLTLLVVGLAWSRHLPRVARVITEAITLPKAGGTGRETAKSAEATAAQSADAGVAAPTPETSTTTAAEAAAPRPEDAR